MPTQKLQDYLDQHDIQYVTISHSPAYTAQEIAASAHVPGKELAKTVMVKLDGKMAMAVLSASQRVNLDELKETSGAASVKLACEKEFADLFQHGVPKVPQGLLDELIVSNIGIIAESPNGSLHAVITRSISSTVGVMSRISGVTP